MLGIELGIEPLACELCCWHRRSNNGLVRVSALCKHCCTALLAAGELFDAPEEEKRAAKTGQTASDRRGGTGGRFPKEDCNRDTLAKVHWPLPACLRNSSLAAACISRLHTMCARLARFTHKSGAQTDVCNAIKISYIKVGV